LNGREVEVALSSGELSTAMPSRPPRQAAASNWRRPLSHLTTPSTQARRRVLLEYMLKGIYGCSQFDSLGPISATFSQFLHNHVISAMFLPYTYFPYSIPNNTYWRLLRIGFKVYVFQDSFISVTCLVCSPGCIAHVHPATMATLWR